MMLNTIVQSGVALLNGSKASKFLTKWKDEMAFIKIDIGDEMRNQIIFEIAFIVCFIIMICVAYAIPFESIVEGNVNFIKHNSSCQSFHI